MELKNCPFCNSDKIEYSIKTTSSGNKAGYNCQFYCKNCHTYGPRVRTKKVSYYDYKGRYSIETDGEIKEQARILWNKRGDN